MNAIYLAAAVLNSLFCFISLAAGPQGDAKKSAGGRIGWAVGLSFSIIVTFLLFKAGL